MMILRKIRINLNSITAKVIKQYVSRSHEKTYGYSYDKK